MNQTLYLEKESLHFDAQLSYQQLLSPVAIQLAHCLDGWLLPCDMAIHLAYL